MRVAPHARSLRELPRALLLLRQPLAAEELEVVVPGRWPIDVAREVVADGGFGPARVDGRRVRAEVIEVGLVEAIALVRKRPERHVDERIDEEAGKHRAIGMTPRLLVGDQLL